MKAVLVVTEKPSVARDIGKILKANQIREGYLEGNGYQITWAVGHLVTLPQPHEIRSEWKAWRRESLPMIPERWPLTVISKTKSQFKVIQTLIKTCSEVICATDAGREGELIFRYIYEATGSKKPVKRLWISSLTPDGILEGFKNLQDWKKYDSLALAARARSQADWLIGMNLSRAYAITSQSQLFVGRVQTPTLAMIVKRDLEIRNFKPEDYFEIHAKFLLRNHSLAHYEGFYLGEQNEISQKNQYLPKKLPPDRAGVQKIVDRMKSGQAKVQTVEAKTEKIPPPLLYDLTELQRHTNRLFGFSASKTLQTAQALYEKHKLISYPRTDSKCLTYSVGNTLSKIVDVIRKPYEKDLHESTGIKSLGPRFINDAEVSDHHAIIPTEVSSDRIRLSEEERKVYDLICRRLLSTWQDDFVTAVTTVVTQIDSTDTEKEKPLQDLFRSQGRVVEQLGWKKLELRSYDKDFSGDKHLPAGIKLGIQLDIGEIKSELKKTKAPPHLTESALLTAMETAGRTIDDRTLAAAIRDSGLGTPATRAGIIETLLARNYVSRKEKSLISTELGEKLIETVHPSVKSPELTARWERGLSQIQSGHQTFENFMSALTEELKLRTQEVLNATLANPNPRASVLKMQMSPKKEKEISSQILSLLSIKGSRPAGRLFDEVSQCMKEIHRREFEQILLNLSESGGIRISQESFEKAGKPITYRKISLSNQQKTDH
jgi:DNA topoisomerase-3